MSLGFDKLLAVDLRIMGDVMGVRNFKKNENKDEMATLVEAGFRRAFSKDIHQLRKS